MNAKVIKTEEDYETALGEVERLVGLDPEPNTPEADRLELLATLVESYEANEFPIPNPDPIDAILFRMEQQGLKQRDLIPYIGSKSKVSEVLGRKRPLTLPMVRAIGDGLGIPTDVLIKPASTSETGSVEEDWAAYPLSAMVKLGWIKTSPQEIHRNREKIIRAYFSRLEHSGEVYALYKTSFQHRGGRTMDTYAIRAWIAQVLISAESRNISAKFDPAILKKDFLTKLIRLSRSEDGPIRARQLLEDNGIACVIVRHLPRTRLDGAAMLNGQDIPIVALTLRYDRTDNFWFTLIHELMHVWLHLNEGYSAFIDDLDIDLPTNPTELEADHIASDLLIPRETWQGNDAQVLGTPEAVSRLAGELGIHPAIIAGAVRKERRNYQMLHNMVGSGQVRKLFKEYYPNEEN